MTRGDDERYMAAALRLAARGLGRTWPNPAVGCLIVQPGEGRPRIVGRGWTQPGGRPHAEAMALAQAGDAARGATAYVTLEPCAHHGRTPPCAHAIIAAGVARVVSALADPDPRVSGQGHARIKAAGIELVEGLLAEQAHAANIGHITRIRSGRPFVQLKLAHSHDGKIAAGGNKSIKITGEAADLYVHHMRAQADAIMIGSGTLTADNPRLTCRLPGAENLSPVRIVLDSGLWTDPSAHVVQTCARVPTWIVTGGKPPPDRAAQLGSKGVKILSAPLEEDGLDLAAVLELLAKEGITRLMVEGGATLAHALVMQDLADEIVLIEGDMTVGKGGLAAFGSGGPDLIQQDGRYALAEERPLGQDVLRKYVKRS